MIITPLRVPLIPAVERLIGLGAPYVRARTWSDYWLYAELFSATCPVAMDNDEVVGVVIAFRSQDDPDDVYIQDVVRHQATAWECHRLYLTSEPDNSGAHATWLSLGFTNIPGDRTINGVCVISNYKGPGKDRAVYELKIK